MRLFVLTGVVSVVIASVAAMVDSLWALRFFVVAVLALLNWYALAKALFGVTNGNLGEIVTGVAIKPLLLISLLIVAKSGGLEVTSFLAGINVFFILLIGYVCLWPAIAPVRPKTVSTATYG
jgi:hypothetical protein